MFYQRRQVPDAKVTQRKHENMKFPVLHSELDMAAGRPAAFYPCSPTAVY